MVWDPSRGGIEKKIDDGKLHAKHAAKYQDSTQPRTKEVFIDPDALRVATALGPRRDKKAININNPAFKNFSRKELDKQEVQRAKQGFMESPFEQTLARIGKGFEYVLSQAINKLFIFGEKGVSQLTTEYDDLINGIDFYVEQAVPKEADRKPIGFSVDATMSSDHYHMARKVLKIKESLDSGVVPILKYRLPAFTNEESPEKFTEATQMPKVLLGVNREKVYEALKSFGVEETAEKIDGSIWLICLRQVDLQLKLYEAYSRQMGDEIAKTKKEQAKKFYVAADRYRETGDFARSLLLQRLDGNEGRLAEVDALMLTDATSVVLFDTLNSMLKKKGS